MSGLDAKVDFTKKEEVLEYLNNLGVEYRFGCYKENKPEVCHLLGDFLQAIEGNKKQAYVTYKQNCDIRNFPSSCEVTGLYRINDKAECGKDWVDGLKYLRRSCDLNSFSGCHRAGYVATLNPNSSSYPFREKPADFEQGLRDLKKACDEGGIGEACYLYSSHFLLGVENVMKPDIPEGLEYSIKACDKNVFQGCFNTARVYDQGLGGIEKDRNAAESYLKRFDKLVNDIKNPQGNVDFGSPS